MSGRLLDFKQYLGGADNVEVIEMFPRNQKKFQYNFGSNVSSYTFSADYQTLVLDTVTYDRVTGDPNFAETNVIGYFANTGNISAATYIDESNENTGVIVFTIPENRYTGAIFPNARQNVVMTVVAFQWDDGASPPRKEMHRWAIIERWEPGVTVGDPTLDTNFIPIGVGAITAVSASGADAARVEGEYSGLTGITNKEGVGAVFIVKVNSSGAATAYISTRGTNYNIGDTIVIRDSQLGGGGAADLTLTVTSVG